MKLLQKKADCHLEFKLEKMKVVLLVLLAWKESFAMDATNKKAFAEKGWEPLNYELLDNKDLAHTHNNQPVIVLQLLSSFLSLQEVNLWILKLSTPAIDWMVV